MLQLFLTYLLPRRVSPPELAFHIKLTLDAYLEYYGSFEATGYRDRETLVKLRKDTSYSMGIIFWRSPRLWLHIRHFQKQAWRLKVVTQLANIHECLPPLGI